MTKIHNLSEDIVKDRAYNVLVDFPISWKDYQFTSYLRVHSTFTELGMVKVDEIQDFVRYKISIQPSNYLDIKGLSGPCEIQISLVGPSGDVVDVLILESNLISNRPKLKGGDNE